MEQSTNNDKRLRIFLKGNGDLVKALLAQEAGDDPLSQGLAAAIGHRYLNPSNVDVVYEESGRLDLLQQQIKGQPLPAQLSNHHLLAPAQLTAQFQSLLWETAPDVVVLSIQPEVAHTLWRHRDEGYLIYLPAGKEASGSHQSDEQWAWLQAHFEPVGLVDVGQFKQTLSAIIGVIRERLGAHVIVVNASSVDPADFTHNYQGTEDSLSLRISRFNLALMQISKQEGISIVDVDRIVAEHGGDQHVLASFHYSPEVNRAICYELVRVLTEIGALGKSPLMKLTMPPFNKEMDSGSIVHWHKQEGDLVNYGDPLCDIKVDRLNKMRKSVNPLFLSNATAQELRKGSYVDTINQTLLMQVTAADTGVLRKIYTNVGERWSIGTLLAVLTVGEDVQVDETQMLAELSTFGVVANLADSLLLKENP